MKTRTILPAVVITTALIATGLFAQSAGQTPPPAAADSPASPLPAPNSIIYIPRLPSPAELASAAAAQGLAIEKIEQTSAQITVVYRYANGQINTVAYQLLPTAGTAPAVATAPVVPASTTTVVYASPTPAYYYYDPYYYSWPWSWSWPVSFDFGIGYGFRHFDGGFRHFGGGFRRGDFHGGGRGGGFHRR